MAIDLKEQFRMGFHASLPLLKEDIDNCPDSLWEKKVGGDFYWQQVFHAIECITSLLSENMEKPKFPLPSELTFLAQYPGMPYIADYKGPHGKDLMYASLDIISKYIDTYFERLNVDELSKIIDFYGTEITVFNRIGIAMSHIMYHLGVLDGALREHGAKASL